MERIKKAYAENGDLKIIPDTPPLDGSENWEQGRGAYYELDNDPNTGDPLALDIDREQDNYFKNVISKNIKHWQENTYPIYFEDVEYPKNATVRYTDGNTYVSKVDNNTALPTDTNNWLLYNPANNGYVELTGNQTIAGVKTFSSSPIVPTPTTDYQVATKKYVDGATLDINALPNKPTPVNTDNFVLQETGGLLKKLSFANLMNWTKSLSLGWGQTWQDVTSSRSLGVAYTNNTGKPIQVLVTVAGTVAKSACRTIFIIDSLALEQTDFTGDTVNIYGQFWSVMVPNGSTYRVDNRTNARLTDWLELI